MFIYDGDTGQMEEYIEVDTPAGKKLFKKHQECKGTKITVKALGQLAMEQNADWLGEEMEAKSQRPYAFPLEIKNLPKGWFAVSTGYEVVINTGVHCLHMTEKAVRFDNGKWIDLDPISFPQFLCSLAMFEKTSATPQTPRRGAGDKTGLN